MTLASKISKLIVLMFVFTITIMCFKYVQEPDIKYTSNFQHLLQSQTEKDKVASTKNRDPLSHQRNLEETCEQGPKKSSNLYFEIGEPIWKDYNLTELYYQFKPFAFSANRGGMRFPHQFGLYTIMKILQPSVIIESGLNTGYITALMRRINPSVLIISMDPRCPKVTVEQQELYCGSSFKDFAELGDRWAQIQNKDNTLIVIDDHQDMTRRLEEAAQFGFKHLIMEDNFGRLFGDSLSLKQILGEIPDGNDILIKDNFGSKVWNITREGFLQIKNKILDKVEIYAEFPPLNRCKTLDFLVNFTEKVRKTKPYYLPWISTNNRSMNREEIDNNLGTGLGITVPFSDDYTSYIWFLHVKLY